MSPIPKISQDQFLGLDFSYSKATIEASLVRQADGKLKNDTNQQLLISFSRIDAEISKRTLKCSAKQCAQPQLCKLQLKLILAWQQGTQPNFIIKIAKFLSDFN